MADILHDFTIRSSPARIFTMMTTPQGLDKWWSKTCGGGGGVGEKLELGFGPGFEWQATVVKYVPNSCSEIKMTSADADWNNTLVGFRLEAIDEGTQVHFYHLGWPEPNQHYRTSTYCWAMLLRILKLHLENGLEVPYEERLNV